MLCCQAPALLQRVTQDVKARFGQRLKTLRKKKGWTQSELADKLGLDRSYLGEIEQGKRNPCLVNLEIIAQGFDMTLGQLLSRGFFRKDSSELFEP
jgi:transcriptional regulator with XRE-family HTH domain